MRAAPPLAALVLALVAGLGACSPDVSLEPPALDLGHDVCDACGMIVSDDRVAAAEVVERDGERVARRYDDIGCMLAGDPAASGAAPLARWVRRFDGGGWLPAERAWYLHSAELATPMLFGLAAGASREDIEGLRRRYAGEVFDYDGLRQRAAAGALHPEPARAGAPEEGSEP